jgi:hypothetical protein
MKYVYKIVCALLAAIVIGVVFFAPIIGVRVHSAMATLLSIEGAKQGDMEILEKIAMNDGKPLEYISDTTSLYDIAFGDTGEFFSAFSALFNLDENEAVKVVVPPMIAFAAALGLTVLCAVAVIGFGLFAKNNRKVIYSSIAGIGSYFLMTKCFGVVEETFVSGRLTLGDLTQQPLFETLGEIVNFELLEPLGAIPIVFGVVIVWTLLYNYTLTPEQKRERKLMLGEAD